MPATAAEYQQQRCALAQTRLYAERMAISTLMPVWRCVKMSKFTMQDHVTPVRRLLKDQKCQYTSLHHLKLSIEEQLECMPTCSAT